MYEVKRNKATGEFKFVLKAGNGQEILMSESYCTEVGCMNGIASAQLNSQREDAFQKKTSSNGKFYFYLKAQNGQIIATSNYYESEAGRDNGIESVKLNGVSEFVNIESKQP